MHAKVLAHAELSRGKTTPRQGCNPIGEHCQELVRRLLEDTFDCLRCPLCQAIVLGSVGYL